jgi:hypothetical protein
MRTEILEYLRAKKAEGNFSVIDIGGASNPWCDDYVDAYLDLNPVPTSKEVFLGDINSHETWIQFRDKQFDFSICSHTLEDICNPALAIGQLTRISRGGFIAVPSKFVELSNIENWAWPGYYHHRWIFDVADGNLIGIPKLPGIFYFSWQNKPMRALNSRLIGQLAYLLGLKRSPRVFGPGVKLKNLSDMTELGVFWERDFDWRLIDYFATHYEYLDLCRRIFSQNAILS